MVSRIFISWICHFWARFWLNFNFGDFRAYFGYFSLVKIDFFEIYFQSWRIKLRVLKFFRPILIIKRHQKNTQTKLFEKFASRQHALLLIIIMVVEDILTNKITGIIIGMIKCSTRWPGATTRIVWECLQKSSAFCPQGQNTDLAAPMVLQLEIDTRQSLSLSSISCLACCHLF